MHFKQNKHVMIFSFMSSQQFFLPSICFSSTASIFSYWKCEMVSPKAQILITRSTYWNSKKEYFCYPSQYFWRQKGLVEALMNRKLWAGRVISCMRPRRRSSKFRSQALECKKKQLYFILCKKGFSFIPNSCLECLHPVACVRSERVITPSEAETHHSTAKEEQIHTNSNENQSRRNITKWKK
jgi:hypothetical protein